MRAQSGKDAKSEPSRVLILLAKDEAKDVAAATERRDMPRHEYRVLQDVLGAERIDYADVRSSTRPFVRLARRLSLRHGLAALGFLRRRDFDWFYCTGEDVAFPFASLMVGALDFGRIISVIHNGDTPKRRVLLRVIPTRVWKNIICLSREQYRVLVEGRKLPAAIVQQSPQWLDTEFYDPKLSLSDHADSSSVPAPGYVFACGRESRDYETLQLAAQGLDIPFHVVASGWSPGEGFAAAGNILSTSNLTVEAGLSYRELRDRYNGARIVVVPVKHVTYAAGVTSICEGMSMGKAVIATSSPGTRDYVHEGESGIVVPVGDVEALRAAILSLWNDADALAQYGERNRAFAVSTLKVELYAESVARLFGLSQ
jgi:glycosyltransferase involved in cell wall biosynthesis